jgi:hypothetical protein
LKRRHAGAWIIAASLLLSVWPARPARAYFERFFVSSRALSLGGAFVALADDPAAAVVNPAGLTQLTSVRLMASFQQPYGLPDLEEHFVAAALPTRFGAVGLSWHRFAMRDATAEDVFTLAYGRDYIRTSQDASLSFGASLDVARVSFRAPYDVSRTAATGSVSVLLRPFPIIGMGYAVRNIGQPTFDLNAGGGRTSLGAVHSLGLAYHWQNRVTLLYERDRGQDAVWRDYAGIEASAGKELSVRAGLHQGDVTGGVGAVVSGVVFDVGVSTHETLGVSYHVSLGFNFPSSGEDDGAW